MFCSFALSRDHPLPMRQSKRPAKNESIVAAFIESLTFWYPLRKKTGETAIGSTGTKLSGLLPIFLRTVESASMLAFAVNPLLGDVGNQGPDILHA